MMATLVDVLVDMQAPLNDDDSWESKKLEALRAGVDALQRLSIIRQRHNSLIGETQGGKPVYCSIHGFELHHLLYDDLDAQQPGPGGDVREVADEGVADETSDHAPTGLYDRAESADGRDGGGVGVGGGERVEVEG